MLPKSTVPHARRLPMAWLLALTVGLGVLNAGAAAAAQPAPALPFDVNRTIEQVHFAFRPTDDGWLGQHETYEVAVRGRAVSVTPLLPRGAPDGAAPGGHAVGRALRPTAGAPLHVETQSVGRQRRPAIALGAPRVERLADGSVAVNVGEAVQHVRNRHDGVEQSWHFAARPAGAGDLLVRLRLSGQGHHAESPSGHHFADPAGGPGLRYGLATWIDASGKRASLRPTFADGVMVLRVPADLVDAAAYPAVLDPLISPEIEFETPVVGRYVRMDRFPRVASDGQDYVVVWALSHDGTRYRGARVSATGVLLDVGGFDVAGRADPATLGDHDVAWAGTHYLFVWADKRAGSANRAIYGARITPAGECLDDEGFIVSAAVGNVPHLDCDAVASGECLVAWKDGRNTGSYDVFAARVDAATATVLDPDGLAIAATPNYTVEPRVARGATGYFVTWSDSRGGNYDVYGARVTDDGAVLDPGGLVVGDDPSVSYAGPDVAFAAGDYMVVFEAAYDVRGVRVEESSGTVRDAPPFVVAAGSAADNHTARIALADASFLVSFVKDRSVGSCSVYCKSVQAVTVTGAGVAGTPFEVAPEVRDKMWVDIASSGSGQAFVVWYEEMNPWRRTGQLGGALIDTDDQVLVADLPVSAAANTQWEPAVAFDGSQYLVVWQDQRGLNMGDIYGVRVRASDGAVVDPFGIAICTDTSDQVEPAVGASEDGFLVVWQDHRNEAFGDGTDIYGTPVDVDGVVLDEDGLVVVDDLRDQESPRVTSSGNEYFVVFEDWGHESNDRCYVYGMWVDQNGAPTQAYGALLMSFATQHTRYPDVTFDGTDYLVVGVRGDAGGTVVGRRFATSHAAVDPSPFTIEWGAGNYPRGTRVAWSGANHLVVWSAFGDVYGMRIAANGARLDTVKQLLHSAVDGYGATPDVAFDGHAFVVLWQADSDGYHNDAFVQRVTRDGVVLDPAGVALTSSRDAGHGLAVEADGAGRSLVTYSRFVEAPDYGNYRVFGATVAWSPNGSACLAARDCMSTFCLNGACCEVADCGPCGTCNDPTSPGVCMPVNEGSPCDDENPCTEDDTCHDGVCLGGPPATCDDENPCTEDFCDPISGCQGNPLADGTPCHDGDFCTTPDTCDAGICAPGPPLECADGNLCTDDRCDPEVGCVYDPNTVPCDDLDSCTYDDACSAGTCRGTAYECTAEPCEATSQCDGSGGCTVTYELPGTPCDDADACTEGEMCTIFATCLGGTPVSCDDGEACTADHCESASGCVQAALPDGTPCGPVDPCGGTDTCAAGVCVPGVPVLVGDPTGDGVVSSSDAQLAFFIALGIVTPSPEEHCAADCNGDDVVSSGDAQLIFYVGLGTGACVQPDKAAAPRE